jgi:predicted HAD superfamily phosphohydrolase
MTDFPPLLLIENPEAFMAVVQNDDPRERVKLLQTFDDVVVCEVRRHGIYNDKASLPGLFEFYRSTVMQAPVERRKEIYRHVAHISPQLGA